MRTDDLAAIPIVSVMARNAAVDWAAIDDIVLGCANQAGEDNRNVARMAALLARLPTDVPGLTVNRLCGSGMDAVGTAARAIKVGEAELMIAGGVESMSRAPFVVGKTESAFSRAVKIEDTTIGWRFVNPTMKQLHGIDSMPETAENVAQEFGISRADQDAFALRSQQRASRAQVSGRLAREIVRVSIPKKEVDLNLSRWMSTRVLTRVLSNWPSSSVWCDRTAQSQPVMHLASTTVHVRYCLRPRRPHSSTVLPRGLASWPWPLPVCRHVLWA